MKYVKMLPWLFLGLFVFTVIRDYVNQLLPTSSWFEVHSVQIMDAREGETPVMVVDRVVHKQFVAEWVASVRRVNKDGLELACIGTGKSDYVTGSKLPLKLDLKWWIGKDCPLTEGKYLLDTTWVLDLGDTYGKRTVTTRSNTFRVRT